MGFMSKLKEAAGIQSGKAEGALQIGFADRFQVEAGEFSHESRVGIGQMWRRDFSVALSGIADVRAEMGLSEGRLILDGPGGELISWRWPRQWVQKAQDWLEAQRKAASAPPSPAGP